VSPLSFDLRRAEPTRRARYYWAMVVPAVVWVVLAVLVGIENSGLQDLDDRVASWGYDLGFEIDALRSFATFYAAASSNWTVGALLLVVAGASDGSRPGSSSAACS
jgi:hypothetical protein